MEMGAARSRAVMTSNNQRFLQCGEMTLLSMPAPHDMV
jgi:hypothetical protein